MTKRLNIYLLAFLTFWMSSWMVTDIHDISIADTAQISHPIFTSQQVQSSADSHLENHEHTSHCSVCSYDHGGYVEQVQAAYFLVTDRLASQNKTNIPFQSDFWYSRNLVPTLRPPIT